MALKNSYDFEYLVNEAERLVFEELEKQLNEDSEICKCQECVLDMAAFALNHTTPNYRASLLGKLYANTGSPKYNNEIKKAVKEAITKIKKNPSHD
ncbi:MAG: late competence development ComFB family protein [Spirochaetales bacterium]|nr:late competence development ComFB family protein [Spirochaetales bacterium]